MMIPMDYFLRLTRERVDQLHAEADHHRLTEQAQQAQRTPELLVEPLGPIEPLRTSVDLRPTTPSVFGSLIARLLISLLISKSV